MARLNATDEEVLFAMGTFMLISSVGLAIIYFQCIKLRRKFREMRERRQQTLQQSRLSDLRRSDLQLAAGEARLKQEESVESLRAELDSMKDLHITVKAQVEGLQELLGRITNEGQLGSSGRLNNINRRRDDEKENFSTPHENDDDANQQHQPVGQSSEHPKYD